MKVTRKHNDVVEYSGIFNPIIISIKQHAKPEQSIAEYQALQTFSEAYQYHEKQKYAKMADRLWQALFDMDDYHGQVIELKKKKQVQTLLDMLELYEAEDLHATKALAKLYNRLYIEL